MFIFYKNHIPLLIKFSFLFLRYAYYLKKMEKGKVSLMEFESNPNIGLYMFVNEKICLIGMPVDEKKKKEIESIFKVPVHTISVLGTELVGVFICGNNDFLFVPDMYDYELEKIEKIAKAAGMEVVVLKDKLNTLGNNMCVSENMIIINSDYTQTFVTSLQTKTGYEIFKFKNPEYKSAGGLMVYIKGKYYVSQEVSESEVTPILKKIGGIGTVNKGAAFVASGIVGNSKGLILGSNCSTVEIQNIVEAFDFL